MKQIKLIAAIILTISSASCSKSMPSDDDAKQTIVGLIGNCKYLSIENFKKINGIQQDNNHYDMAIEYSIRVKPIPELKSAIEAQSKQLSEINEKLKPLEAQSAAVSDEFTAILNGPSNPTQEQIEESQKKQAPIYALIAPLKTEKLAIFKSIDPETKFLAACPIDTMLYSKLHTLNSDLYHSLDPELGSTQSDKSQGDLTQFTKEFTKNFSENITMIKTDNGWVLAN